MAFGQQPGPPASSSQVRRLLALLQAAGYEDFREARGPMGLTQRQGGGRFTRDEAAAFIQQLEDAGHGDGDGDGEGAGTAPPPAPLARLSATERALRALPAERLAAELQRRGWVVLEP